MAIGHRVNELTRTYLGPGDRYDQGLIGAVRQLEGRAHAPQRTALARKDLPAEGPGAEVRAREPPALVAVRVELATPAVYIVPGAEPILPLHHGPGHGRGGLRA